MAKDYLAASATGVPVERFFSGGTDIVTPKRGKLKAATIKEIMCLKYWLKIKDNNYYLEDMVDALKEKLGMNYLLVDDSEAD